MSKYLGLTTYRARDRRVYYGALCSDMQKEVNHTEYLMKRMRKADPTSNCTYFPMEDRYLVFTNSNILENPDLEGPSAELTGNFHTDIQMALIEAIEVLESRNKE